MQYVVFYSNTGKGLCSYTKDHTFPGEKQATIELLAYENSLSVEDIIVKEEER